MKAAAFIVALTVLHAAVTFSPTTRLVACFRDAWSGPPLVDDVNG